MGNIDYSDTSDNLDNQAIGPMEIGYLFATIPFFIFVASLVVEVILSYM